MRFSFLFALAALASLACAVPNLPDETAADEQASTDPTTPRRTTSKGDAGTATPPPASGGAPAPSPAPSSAPSTPAPAPAPTNACATAANQDACFRCCDVANPNAMPLLQNEWGKCVCESPGVCAGVCSSQYCAGQGVLLGGACDNCLDANDASCSTKAETKCAADPTCKPYLTCTTDAKCASKPM